MPNEDEARALAPLGDGAGSLDFYEYAVLHGPDGRLAALGPWTHIQLPRMVAETKRGRIFCRSRTYDTPFGPWEEIER